jgi:hypothetical protein
MTYADMIEHALLSTPDKQLYVAEIYDYFVQVYGFDQRPVTDPWKLSIRHTLSVNPSFVRVVGSDGAVGSRGGPKKRGVAARWTLSAQRHGELQSLGELFNAKTATIDALASTATTLVGASLDACEGQDDTCAGEQEGKVCSGELLDSTAQMENECVNILAKVACVVSPLSAQRQACGSSLISPVQLCPSTEPLNLNGESDVVEFLTQLHTRRSPMPVM